MKKTCKALSLIMSVILLFSITACSDNNVANNNQSAKVYPQVPDKVNYFNSDQQMIYSAYSSLSDGRINYDGSREYYVGEDYVNKERIKEYFDAGMTYIFPQTTANASGDFETSKLKKVMDIAVELGYEKSVVVTDNAFYRPYEYARADMKNETDWQKITCIGTSYSWQYASEDELDEAVEASLRKYCFHPAFQGVFMPDEPHAKYFKVLGEVYRSLRRVQAKLGIEDMYINANLLPYFSGLVNSAFPAVEESFHASELQRQHEAYRRYLDRFLTETGAKQLQVDIYPMYDWGIYRCYITNLQLMAEVAKKHDASIVMVTQAAKFSDTRYVSEADLNYLLNITAGFGAKHISFFTYFTHEFDGTNIFDENGSFVSTFGDKTPVYYMAKDLMAESQELAKSIINFDYNTSKVYLADYIKRPYQYMEYAYNYSGKGDFAEFTKLTDYEINIETGIVTELYDEEKDNYMYMAFNSVDTMYKGSSVYQTAKLTFTEEFNKALVYYNGDYKVYDLDADHSLTVKMRPGEAHYVIPYAE